MAEITSPGTGGHAAGVTAAGMRIGFLYTRRGIDDVAPHLSASAKVSAPGDSFNRSEEMESRPIQGSGNLSNFIGLRQSSDATIAHNKLKKLVKAYKNVESRISPARKDRDLLATLQRKQTALGDDIKQQYDEWCGVADLEDPKCLNEVLKVNLPFAFRPERSNFQHVLYENPALYVTIMQRVGKIERTRNTPTTSFPWGDFFRGPPELVLERMGHVATHCEDLGESSLLHGSPAQALVHQFIGLCKDHCKNPELVPLLLNTWSVLHPLVPTVRLDELINQPTHNDDAAWFVNELLADYLGTNPKDKDSVAQCRLRVEGLAEQPRPRLPFAEMFEHLRNSEREAAAGISVQTKAKRDAAIELLASPDAQIRMGAQTSLASWVEGASPAALLGWLKAVCDRFPEGPGRQAASNDEAAVINVDFANIIEAAVLRAADTPAHARKTLEAVRPSKLTSGPALSALLALTGPKAWVAQIDTLPLHDERGGEIGSTVLRACASSRKPGELRDWLRLLEALPHGLSVEHQELSDAHDAVLENLDMSQASDRELLTNWLARFQNPLPVKVALDFAQAAIDTGQLASVVELRRSCANTEVLDGMWASNLVASPSKLLALAHQAAEGSGSRGLALALFQRITEAAPKKAIAKGLPELHTKLSRFPSHRVPPLWVRALIGMPPAFDTGDLDADLGSCLGSLRDEAKRPAAMARIREVVTTKAEPDVIGVRMSNVFHKANQAMGFVSWFRGGKKQRAEADAQQLVKDVLEPGFANWANVEDLSDPDRLSYLIKQSLQFEKKGHVFSLPEKRLTRIDAKSLSQVDAMGLLRQPSATAQKLASERLLIEYEASPDIKEQANLLGHIRRAVLSPALKAPTATEPGDIWLDGVAQGLGFHKAPGEGLLQTLEQRLEQRINKEWATAPNSDEQVHLLSALSRMPASLQRNAILNRLTSGDWTDKKVLGFAAPLVTDQPPLDSKENLLSQSLENFPADSMIWLDYLQGTNGSSAVLDALGLKGTTADDATLADMKALWQSTSGPVRRDLLARNLRTMFSSRQVLPNGKSAAEQGKELIATHVAQQLEADPDLTKWAPDFVTVINGLPAVKRAELLAEVILSPADGLDLMTVVIRHGGILAIKSAQQLAQDPDVPLRVRLTLQGFLENNQELTPIEIWKRIPAEMQRSIHAIGPRLGTGSAKQTFLARTTFADEPLVGAVTLPQAKEELEAVAAAAQSIQSVDYLLKRLKPLVLRELDLKAESKAFELVGATQTGRAPETRHLQVHQASVQCLLRDGFDGLTLNQMLAKGPLPAEVKQRLRAVHRTMIMDAFDTRDLPEDVQTFVFTDPHLANLADDGEFMYVFDPGQYGSLTKEEATLFVRMLVAFGKPKLGRMTKDKLLADLSPLLGGDLAELRDTYDAALDEAGSAGYRLQMFFNACSKAEFDVPAGFFASAKMMHNLISQTEDLGLGDHVADAVQDLFVQQLGPWGKVKAWWKINAA